MNKLVAFTVVLVLALSKGPVAFLQGSDDEFEAFKFCFNFENLSLGNVYVVGEDLAVTGAHVKTQDFQWGNSDWTDKGHATIEDGGKAGGWGYEIRTNNINLMFEFEEKLKGLVLLYGEYGGNVNLTINDKMVNVEDFSKVDGNNIGGVDVLVIPLNGPQGIIVMKGEITSISIGGQELWIDDSCKPVPGEFPQTGCVTFDLFNLGDTYTIKGKNLFTESGVLMETREYQWGGGNWYFGGFATIDDRLRAGGKDKELNTKNINIEFNFPRRTESIHLLFGAYGGNLNFEINGDFFEFGDFSTISGANIGGADITVTGGSGNGKGEIYIKGAVQKLIVGGQELWIDEVCWVAPE